MNMLRIVGNTPATASTVPTEVHSTVLSPIDASALRQDTTGDDLDALMTELGIADPTFGALLSEAAKQLAPLATTRDGQITMTSLRMRAGLTQRQLAEKIGQKQSNVSLFESGQRTDLKRPTMRLLCSALECDMNTLDQALENSSLMLEAQIDRQEAERLDNTSTRDCA